MCVCFDVNISVKGGHRNEFHLIVTLVSVCVLAISILMSTLIKTSHHNFRRVGLGGRS